MNRRSRMTTHYFFHRFSRKFNILNKVRTNDIYVNIIYKRKAQKINSMNAKIMNKSKLKLIRNEEKF